jgi:N-acetylneuraminic acid mutarotase
VKVLRRILLTVVAVLAGAGLVGGVLVLTNPGPEQRESWAELPELPEPRGEVASAVGERDGRSVVVVAGGLRGLTATTSQAVHLLDLEAGVWRQLPDLPAPRHHPGAAILDGDVYLSGGAPSATDWVAQDSLWVLREGAGEWETLTPMPEPRDSHRLRELDGRLYVVGGLGGADTLVYDPPSDAWSRAPALPFVRDHLAVVVHDGALWAIGGRADGQVLDTVHIWSPGDDSWREGPRLPMPISAAIEGALGGVIHLVGGEDPATVRGGVLDVHLALDVDEQVWREEEPAPVSVHGGGGGAIDGRLVVTGGSRRQGALSPLAWTGLTAAHPP